MPEQVCLKRALSRQNGYWAAHHIYTQGDRDLLLLDSLAPLVRRLLQAGTIDHFFFVRYSLGGPHIRLRWRLVGDPQDARDALEQACARFFRQHPPRPYTDLKAIHQINQSLIDSDPQARETDDEVVPPGTCRGMPTLFEVERYGGPAALAHSLDAFAVSSVCVLDLLNRCRDLAASRRRPLYLAALADLALGLATGPEDACALLNYGSFLMGPGFGACEEQADTVFERQSSSLLALLESRLRLASGPATDRTPCLFLLGRRLAVTLAEGSASKRWRIAVSHLHMTANRLGMLNSEEVYLCRLLSRSGQELLRQPAACGDLWPTPPLPAAAALAGLARHLLQTHAEGNPSRTMQATRRQS